MNNTLKIVIAVVLAALVFGTGIFVYASSQNSKTDSEQTLSVQDLYVLDNGTQVWQRTCSRLGRMRSLSAMRMNDLQWMKLISENATLSTVQGTVVSVTKGVLILNSDSGQIRVLLPRIWTSGSETMNRTSLFSGAFSGAGQTVTIKVLESFLFSNADFNINIMLGYEAINATSAHAFAVLPFNIQTSS